MIGIEEYCTGDNGNCDCHTFIPVAYSNNEISGINEFNNLYRFLYNYILKNNNINDSKYEKEKELDEFGIKLKNTKLLRCKTCKHSEEEHFVTPSKEKDPAAKRYFCESLISGSFRTAPKQCPCEQFIAEYY